MKNKKRLAPLLPYLAVWAGLFLFNSAWGALLGFHLAILISLFIFGADIPISLLFKSKYSKWILASIILCGLSGVILYFAWDWFGVYSNLPAQIKSLGLNSGSWFPFIVYFSIVNPLLEEYFWRGFLGSDTKKLYIGDFVFAGYHAMILWSRVQPLSVLVGIIFLVTAGWLWRQIRREDEGLLAPVLGHAAADLTILVCIYLQTN